MVQRADEKYVFCFATNANVRRGQALPLDKKNPIGLNFAVLIYGRLDASKTSYFSIEVERYDTYDADTFDAVHASRVK